MTRRAHAIAIALRRRPEPSPWLIWAMLALLLLVAVAAQAQTSVKPGNAPVANAPVPTRPLRTGPTTQTRGVLVPTRPVDPDIHAPAPPASAFPMPVVRPPGTPGGNTTVVPK